MGCGSSKTAVQTLESNHVNSIQVGFCINKQAFGELFLNS